MRRSKGFTLIELLIVMAVIAILIAIAIPSFRGMQQEARKTKAQGDLRVLKIAIESYYKNNGNIYPPVGDTWEDLLAGATVSPNIITSALIDPFGATNTSQYKYALSDTDRAAAKYYLVWSVGPSGTASTAPTISAGGTVTSTDTTVIWDSNGH